MKLNLYDDMGNFPAFIDEEESRMMSRKFYDEPQNNALSENLPLGMAYVPFQKWGETFSDEKAFDCGTLFPDLVFPFEEGGRK